MPEIRPISKELQGVAKRILHELPNRVDDDINHIRNWLAQQPHIHPRTDDQWILNFLRCNKFSLERTKEKFDMYYTTRTLMPTYFTNRDPFLPDMQEVLNRGLMLPLPRTVGNDGPRIIIMRCPNLDTKLSYQTLAKAFFMITDVMLYEDDSLIIGGAHVFTDLSGSSLEYFLTINLNEVKKISICLEKSYPSRPQAVDIVNCPAFYETLFSLIRSLLSSKIKERVHVYGKRNADDIFKIIPRTHLPKEYGGECSSIPELTAYWKNKVESYRDWLLEDEQYRTDETKRPGKPKTSEEWFGVEGSFRKLDLD